MLEALQSARRGVDAQGGNAIVCMASAGVFPVKEADLFLGNAGTAFRSLTAALALAVGATRCPACRACTSGRSAIWSMRCASWVPMSPTAATKVSRRCDPSGDDSAGGVVHVRGDVSSQFLTGC
jgi:3-phosphoshikimate 1-carboxyvinyltransferase